MRAFGLIVLAGMALAAVVTSPAGAIIGGRPASEPYPWTASLQYGDQHYCGGVLVRPDWVVTAGHCVQGMQVDNYKAVLGRAKLSAGGGEAIPVDDGFVHELYPDDYGSYDIALLHLARPSSAPPLRVVGLDEAALWGPGKPARTMGWGDTVPGANQASDDLIELDAPMVSDADCTTRWVALSEFNPEADVCAGETVTYEGTCNGDSGGPLIVKDAAGAWTLAGLVEEGLPYCLAPVFYPIYVRVGGPAIRTWLDARLPPLGAAPVPAPAPPAAAAPLKLTWARYLRPVRRSRRTRTYALVVTVNGRVTGVRVTLLRGSRVLATGRLARLGPRGTVLLRVRGAVKAKTLRLRLRASDGAGRTVTATGLVRIPRRVR